MSRKATVCLMWLATALLGRGARAASSRQIWKIGLGSQAVAAVDAFVAKMAAHRRHFEDFLRRKRRQLTANGQIILDRTLSCRESQLRGGSRPKISYEFPRQHQAFQGQTLQLELALEDAELGAETRLVG